MSKRRKIIKWSLIIFTSLILVLFGFGYWFMSLLSPRDIVVGVENTLPKDLPYITENQLPYSGKILAVVTSTDVMGESEMSTGYELTELSRAYYVFQANGFVVDIASPLGGKPPVVIDDDDMGVFDYAFLNDSIAQKKANNTIAMQAVNADEYAAIYFVGGKGAMFDFPQNKYIQSIVRDFYESGKVIGAVCHGPAALINVTLSNGSLLLKDKTVSSFSNKEELFLIADAATIFPFLLEDKLVEKGAVFKEGHMYLENVISDGNLVTGQNPWSTWAIAEAVVKQLGREPKKREKTGEENSVAILIAFETYGYDQASNVLTELRVTEHKPVNRELIAVHSIVAAMKWDLMKAFGLVRLLHHAKVLAL